MVMVVSTEEFGGGVNIETLISLPNTPKGKSTPQTSVSQAVLSNALSQLWHFRADDRILPTNHFWRVGKVLLVKPDPQAQNGIVPDT